MGNKWELQDRKNKVIKICPCGKGAYVSIRSEYEDDYLRARTRTDNKIDCIECETKYMFYNKCWVTKENYEIIREKETTLDDFEKQVYRKLYNEYYDLVLDGLKTKKGLYDFLYSNRLFNMPGTLQTFYKNGAEYYIDDGSRHYCNLHDLYKLIDLNVGLSKEDNQLINDINEKKNAIKVFLVNVAV